MNAATETTLIAKPKNDNAWPYLEKRDRNRLVQIDCRGDRWEVALFLVSPCDYQAEERTLIRCRTFKSKHGALVFAAKHLNGVNTVNGVVVS